MRDKAKLLPDLNSSFESLAKSGIIRGVGALGGPDLILDVIVLNEVMLNCLNVGIVVLGCSEIHTVQIDQSILYNNPETAILIHGAVNCVLVPNKNM